MKEKTRQVLREALLAAAGDREPTDAELDALEELDDPRGYWEPPEKPDLPPERADGGADIVIKHLNIRDG